jgi:hypothetical protein
VTRNPWEPNPSIFGFGGEKKKRRNISFTEKAILWEKDKRHICHICKKKIHSMTEAQCDHVKAHSKGGQTVRWAHSSCNRLKGNKPLSVVQKRLGVYKPKKSSKKKTKRRRRSSSNPFGFTVPTFKSPF